MQADQQPQSSIRSDYLALIKSRLLTLVVISTGMGYYLASGQWAGFTPLICVILGVALVGGGANGLNQWVERRIDPLMNRTASRPLPGNRIPANHALVFTLSISIVGFIVLWVGVNSLTLILSFLSWFTYLFIYTPLKRVSVLNTWVGAVPGALPALLGYTAASGVIDKEGAALFMVLYFWQMPHFFAISWVYKEDYSKGGFKMLSLEDAEGRFTAIHILLHTVLMVAASSGLYYYSSSSWLYALGAAGIGLASLLVALRFFRVRTQQQARAVFKLSLIYVPVLFLSLILDRLFFG